MDDLDRLALAAAREIVEADGFDPRTEDDWIIFQTAKQVIAMFDQRPVRYGEA